MPGATFDIVLCGDRLPKPNNFCPGYGLNYVRDRYFINMQDFDQKNKLIEIIIYELRYIFFVLKFSIFSLYIFFTVNYS